MKALTRISILTLSALLSACAGSESFFAISTHLEPLPPAPVTAEEVKEVCEGSNVNALVQEVVVPPMTKTCSWNQNDNLGIRDGWIQARESQSIALNLPAGAVICDMKIHNAAQQIRFDDEMIVLFNDVPIMASDRYVTSVFTADSDGLLIYNWLNLQGKQYLGYYQNYCLPGSTCTMPRSETTGPVSLEFEPSALYKLSAKANRSSEKEFKIVVTGDNDASDCQHTGLSFTAEVNWSPAQ